ncbi:hypothetical protein ACWKW9_24175, partial [Rhizobium daejeonense]
SRPSLLIKDMAVARLQRGWPWDRDKDDGLPEDTPTAAEVVTVRREAIRALALALGLARPAMTTTVWVMGNNNKATQTTKATQLIGGVRTPPHPPKQPTQKKTNPHNKQKQKKKKKKKKKKTQTKKKNKKKTKKK